MLYETHEDPLGISPSKVIQGATRGKEKILLTSVGIEPTTSRFTDLPLLCRLSYEVGQRKSGTIMEMNWGEEKVRVHMNAVPRSTINTNGRTECKFKCHVKPIKDPLGVSPRKGNR